MTLPSERGRPSRPSGPGPRGTKPALVASETIDPVMEVFGLSALWRLRTASDETPPSAATDTADAVYVGADADADAPRAADAPPQRIAARVSSPAEARSEAVPVRPVVTRTIDLATLDFDGLRRHAQGCEACRLCETRKNVVFGVGDPRANWLFVGEGPGANEDEQGEPFVGQAGKLLDNMLRALGLRRDENVFIANVVKCRPPGNRDPLPDEIAACEGYLQRQIALIQPKIIVALGRFAAQTLLRSDATIGALRRLNAGSSNDGLREDSASTPVHHYEGVPVVVTYHPAYLLRTPSDKAKVWEDLCRARDVFAR